MDVPRITIAVGLALVALGLVGYVGSGASSVTALIPTFFGIVLAVLGQLARAEERRATMMHVAVGLAVLGILGSAMGLADLPALVRGDTSVERPWAVAVQSIMAVVLVAYVAVCVRSFVAARRARETTGG